MADSRDDASRSTQWYRDRWEELREMLSAPLGEASEDVTDLRDEDVVARVRELQLSALSDEADAVLDADGNGASEARRVLQRVHHKLQHLRRENRALNRIRDLLGASTADEAVASVRALHEQIDALRDRVETLEAQRTAFDEVGIRDADHALSMIRSMEAQLHELYGEKEATERTDSASGRLAQEGDTFQQLQALLAREEKLRRELGVSSSEQVIEMVNGLAEQLEDVYADRSSSVDDEARTFVQLDRLLEREQTLREELGVSDPAHVVAMVRGLADQLDELYAARQQLARINLRDADGIVDMVSSMQEQLELLYENQERMSEHGIHDVDHALAMIESMEQQLNALYANGSDGLACAGDTAPSDIDPDTLDALRDQLDTLREEKAALKQTRETLRTENASYASTFDTLEQRFGTTDPEHLAALVASMEKQLNDVYRNREAASARPAPSEAPPEIDAFVDTATLSRLDDLSDDQLDALPFGAVQVDDNGVVMRANAGTLALPDVDADAPAALLDSNFFFDLAPGANNTLFRGRFRDGLDGTLDARFPYTFISRGAPPANFAVHLYRTEEGSNWILFAKL